MFLASAAKPIDDNLKKIVEQIEEQSLSLTVLAARQLRYNLHQTHVEVTIKELRPFNVLEEFIIRAGIEFQPPPTADELALVLGLDAVFIKSTISTLQSLQTLALTPQITVTSEGKSFYEQSSVPKPPYSLEIYTIYDPLLENITCQYESLNSDRIHHPDLADFINFDSEQKLTDFAILTPEERLQIIQSANLDLHLPEQGKIVTACKLLSPTQKIWQNISLFVIFDALEDKLSIQIRKGQQILEPASQKLETLHNAGTISLQSLCQLSDETIAFEREASLKYKNEQIEKRLNKLQKNALKSLTKKSPANKSQQKGTARQLRDDKIAQVFWEVLNSAQQQILIYSPWVNETVVDERFFNLLQKLANRGVRILIGHGIAKQQEEEDKPISPEIETELRNIQTPDGLPGVQIFWLGSSHIKEVIVDQKIYLCGYHDWLSDRSDYLPRGESVYQVTIPEQVQEAYDFLASRFQNHAQNLWKNAVQNRDSQLAVEVLSVWGTLDLEEIAIKEIEENDFLELMPIWLKIRQKKPNL
ncbi:MAG TPA: hypothetical protein VK203_09420 [Nostocaceae cyanobacterium]|nr:hypothetical protein [Nostocaceae cyanobacterium]